MDSLELWRNFICGNETGSPGRAVSLHLARSGSQSEHRIRRILPARGACHIIINSIVLFSNFIQQNNIMSVSSRCICTISYYKLYCNELVSEGHNLQCYCQSVISPVVIMFIFTVVTVIIVAVVIIIVLTININFTVVIIIISTTVILIIFYVVIIIIFTVVIVIIFSLAFVVIFTIVVIIILTGFINIISDVVFGGLIESFRF